MRMGAWSMARVLRQRIEYYLFTLTRYTYMETHVHRTLDVYIPNTTLYDSSSTYLHVFNMFDLF